MNRMEEFENLPNKLTIFRIYVFLFCCINVSYHYTYTTIIAVGVFIIASLTDMLDGKIVRKYNLVINFESLYPLADKLLVSAALIRLCGSKIPVWIVIIIISRELFISGFRTLAASGIVLLQDGGENLKQHSR